MIRSHNVSTAQWSQKGGETQILCPRMFHSLSTRAAAEEPDDRSPYCYPKTSPAPNACECRASKCQCEENTHAGTRITARFFVCQETGRNLADSKQRILRFALTDARSTLLKKILYRRGTERLQRC